MKSQPKNKNLRGSQSPSEKVPKQKTHKKNQKSLSHGDDSAENYKKEKGNLLYTGKKK